MYDCFCYESIEALAQNKSEYSFVVYTDLPLEFNTKNICVEIVKYKKKSFSEQFQFLKILLSAKHNLMIFFDAQMPLLYRGEYFLFINSLKEIYYQNFSSHFQKYISIFALEKAIKKAKKVLCFDQNTHDEIIERFNIIEKNIAIIPGFFPKMKKLQKSSEIPINIKAKHNIQNDFFIYSFGDGIEKNLDRLLKVMKNLNKNHNLDLVILGDDVAKNISLRNKAIELEIQKHIHFL